MRRTGHWLASQSCWFLMAQFQWNTRPFAGEGDDALHDGPHLWSRSSKTKAGGSVQDQLEQFNETLSQNKTIEYWGWSLGVECLPEVCRALGSVSSTYRREKGRGVLSEGRPPAFCECLSRGDFLRMMHLTFLPFRHRTRTSAQFHQQSSLNQCSRTQMTLQFRMTLCRQVCFHLRP